MNIKVPIAILAVRGVRLVARVLHKGGTAKPGEIALKICPDLLSHLSRGVKTVVITGTNGKTTTARMVEQVFADAGYDYIANRSGANLISGITTEFALKSTIFGRCKSTHAVIECDEAACRRTLGQLKPEAVLITNLFRDQVDRFGDVSVTLQSIREGLEKVPEATICINADCPLCSSLSTLPNPRIYYGLEKGAFSSASTDEGDVRRCPLCGGELKYAYRSFGHLGGWECTSCGSKRAETQLGVREILASTSAGSTVAIAANGEVSTVNVNLPAVYNIYNAAGASAAAMAMGFTPEKAYAALENFSCGFGRMETLPIGQGARMMLVKNPTGCRQVLDFLSGLDENFDIVICLNDKSGDGTDISWIWETDFERLADLGEKLGKVTVSGIRWADMALRLKYAGIDESKIACCPDYEELCDELEKGTLPAYIIPTYSAMLELRSHIVRRTGGAEFWEG